MSAYTWPDPQGILDDLTEYFSEEGEVLKVRVPEDLPAGINRARMAEDYEADVSPFQLAALIFEGVATRHPLVDGNKRLAWQSAVTFLGLNSWYLDAPEVASFDIGMEVIGRTKTAADLAAFFEVHAIRMD